MSLEHLPYEVVEVISRYLDVKDILACGATCSLMRHVFNGDLIWKRKCNIELTDYLNTSECRVEPSLEWLEVVDNELSSLSPLSTWRKNYMMEVRLFQNWREGRYEKEELEFGTNSAVYHTTSVEFYQDDYIFLHSKVINEAREQNEIWNVSESPYLHSTFSLNFSDFFEGTDDHHNLYEIVDDKLAVSKGNLVLIYDICLSTFSAIPLFCAFLFDLSEDKSKSLITRARSEPGFSLRIQHKAGVVICCNCLIGSVENSQTIHIWDVLSGKKVTEVNFPIISHMKDKISICSDQSNKTAIFKLVLPREKYRFHYYGYDLSKMELSPFHIKHNYCDVLSLRNNCVIGADSQQLFSYDYETSEKRAVRKCNYQILKNTITIVGSNLLCGTCDSTIFIMNASSLIVLSSVKLSFTLYSLKPICNKFVMINNVNTELWDIRTTSKRMLKFPTYGSFAAVNEHSTKIALEYHNKIIIWNFW